MLLSVDWDYYAGSSEHVFDSPLWGSPDLEYHRHERWRELAQKRGGSVRTRAPVSVRTRAPVSSFEALREDFPLYGNPLELLILEGLPCFAALSHESGIDWLERVQQASPQALLNLDSHHDLYSSSGDASRVRPGNWVGHALERGLISHYTCLYPSWHSSVAVSEGFDVERTWSEIGARASREQVSLERLEQGRTLESAIVPLFTSLRDVSSVLLVQSPAWTSPLYDPIFLELIQRLEAQILTPPMARAWT